MTQTPNVNKETVTVDIPAENKQNFINFMQEIAGYPPEQLKVIFAAIQGINMGSRLFKQ